MKPVIQRELDALRQRIDDLETRLKNENVQLGHRAVFDIGKRGEVPAPTLDDRSNNRVLGTTGWIAQSATGSGGAGTPDGHTLAVVTGVLNAEPLSGTIDARFTNLSGTIDGHFNALTFLTGVAHDGTLTGDGTGANPLSASPLSGTIDARFVNLTGSLISGLANLSGTINARVVNLSGTVDGHFNALSGTINSAFSAFFSGSQVWSQTANGTEGTTLTAVLPMPYPNTSYYAFITNTSGTTSPVYRVTNKSSASFQVISTAPFVNAARIDFLTITGGLGPVWDGSVLANLSQSIDAHFVTLSGSIDGHFNDLSGSINSRFSNFSVAPTGTLFISSGTLSATNLSTEGNIDWLALTSFLDPPRAQTAAASNSKRGGGYLRNGFDWVLAGQVFNQDAVSNGAGATTTAADTLANAALSANTTKARMYSLSSPTNGWGYQIVVPCDQQTRTLRVATCQFSCVMAYSASLGDASATPVSCILSTGASALITKLVTVTYNASRPTWLTFTATVVGRYTSDPNMQFGWATISGNI